jgi:hypothetical protein
VLAAALAALAVAGCGDSGEPEGRKLPPELTSTLLQQLESVGDRVAAGVAGACDDIYASADDDGNIQPIDITLSSIPPDVDPEIRTALEQSFERLKQLVDQECEEIRSAEQEEQDRLPEETVPDETTETETVPTETETTPTDTETTPTETDESPDTETPPGKGPDGLGPPGQQGQQGGAEAPDGGGD